MAVVNDFRNETSFVDYRRYGTLQVWDASVTSGPRRPQRSTDRITVYLNFRPVGEFTETAAARALVKALLNQAPVDLSEFLDV